MEVILKNYHYESDKETEALKRAIIKQIAQNPIEFVDLHRIAYKVDKHLINKD